MPSLTFLNLDADKKQKIIDSATKEFELYTLKGAKVVRIIKRVNISRASFYKYFEGIEDLYFYILDKIAGKTLGILKAELVEFDGDFFKAWEALFQKYLSTPKLYDSAVSRIFTIKHKESKLYARRYNENLKNRIIELCEMVDFDKLTISTPQELVDLLSISVSIVERILSYMAIDFYDVLEAKKIFRNRMNLIRHNVVK
ncbi:TetR/AcrR family transcriptional regulator [Mycoplasmatota bacterium WC44]